MARVSRHFLSGSVWYLTHRYHKKDFLLKLVKDSYHAAAVQNNKHLIILIS